MFISLCHEGIFFFLGTDFALPCVQTRCWSNILNNVPGVSVCVSAACIVWLSGGITFMDNISVRVCRWVGVSVSTYG